MCAGGVDSGRGCDQAAWFVAVQDYLLALRLGAEPSSHARAGWARFFRDCNALLTRRAARLRIPSTDRQDCIQDVWVTILFQLPRFVYDPDKGTPAAWLRSLIRRSLVRCASHFNGHRSTQLTTLAEASIESRERDPVEAYWRSCDEGAFEKALDKVRDCSSAPCWETFYLHDIVGLRTQAIASRLGIGTRQVRKRVQLVRARLRRIVEQIGL